MKYSFLIILLSLTPLCTFCQNNFNDIGEREGLWLGYHENGTIKYTGQFINGKEIGSFNYFDYAGNKVIHLNYTEPGDVCEAVLFYTNGLVQSKGQYRNKMKEKLWIYYNQKEEKISEENYSRGLLEGECIYYQNGSVSETYTFSNGEKNGLSKMYYPSGNLNMSSNYLNNLLHGQVLVYFNDNNFTLESEGFFFSGLKDSIWIFYNDLGDTINIEKYEKGQLIDADVKE